MGYKNREDINKMYKEKEKHTAFKMNKIEWTDKQNVMIKLQNILIVKMDFSFLTL